jgi:hypothetical protein
VKRARAALALGWILGAQLAACSPFPDAWPPPFARLEAFPERDEAVHRGSIFDLVATDMDLDGDPDLLINWHHERPLELFENRAGRFEHINRPGDDAGGLYDNRDVPDLFAGWAEVAPRIERSGSTPGLYLWHDADRRGGDWRFRWIDPEGRYGRLDLEVEGSLAIADVDDLKGDELETLGRRRVRVSLESGPQPRGFGVDVRGVSNGLVLRRVGDPAAEIPPVFVGADLTRIDDEPVQLWKPDPHGLAWIDVAGTGHPELYITRGAHAGNLQRLGGQPKADRYYAATGSGSSLYRMAAPGVVPVGYGRGRKVEWADVDGDGTLELSVGNKETPNALLEFDRASGVMVDRAAEVGLDLAMPSADVHTWGDLDGDGLQDLVYLEGAEFQVARNRGERTFERLTGESLGLVLPSLEPTDRLFDSTSLRLADFDNDGDLDLWVLALGWRRSNHIFRRDGQRFVDVSAAVGLGGIRDTRAVVLLDVDNDGFEDAVSFGDTALLWRNLDGERFQIQRLSEAIVAEPIGAATALDADGDGRTDLVVVGERPHLLRNAALNENGYLAVALRSRSGGAPIGALVQAHFDNGMSIARRYGSASNSAYSQAIQPLHFGIRNGLELKAIVVRWPGGQQTTISPVRTVNQTVVIGRP